MDVSDCNCGAFCKTLAKHCTLEVSCDARMSLQLPLSLKHQRIWRRMDNIIKVTAHGAQSYCLGAYSARLLHGNIMPP